MFTIQSVITVIISDCHLPPEEKKNTNQQNSPTTGAPLTPQPLKIRHRCQVTNTEAARPIFLPSLLFLHQQTNLHSSAAETRAAERSDADPGTGNFLPSNQTWTSWVAVGRSFALRKWQIQLEKSETFNNTTCGKCRGRGPTFGKRAPQKMDDVDVWGSLTFRTRSCDRSASCQADGEEIIGGVGMLKKEH